MAGVAATGEDAVRKARETRPDLILMDITLRGPMTGVQAAEHILDERTVPVLFLTAAIDLAGIRRIQGRTACGFTSKPFEEQAFIAEVRKLLPHDAD